MATHNSGKSKNPSTIRWPSDLKAALKSRAKRDGFDSMAALVFFFCRQGLKQKTRLFDEEQRGGNDA